jgi:hypothetical protein
MEKFGFEVLGQCTPNKPKGKFASLENLDEAGKKIDLKHHPVFKGSCFFLKTWGEPRLAFFFRKLG